MEAMKESASEPITDGSSEEKLKKELPNLGRVFFARLFDVIITAIPSVFMTFFYLVNDWSSALLVICVGLGTMFCYFVVLAYFLHGNTLGKLIFKIRLVRYEKSLSFWALLYRETYYLFIPNIILLVAQVIAMTVFYFMNKNAGISDAERSSTTSLIINLGYLTYVIWYFFICITIYLQKDHQSGVDYQLKIVCLLKTKAKSYQKPVTEKPKIHVHLQEQQPGIIKVEDILRDPNTEENTEGENNE